MARKSEHIDGCLICPQKIKSAAHISARRDIFEVKDRPFQAAEKVFLFSGDKTRAKLEALFLILDDIGQNCVFGDGEFADFEMSVKAVAIDVLDIWARCGGLDGHFPLFVGQRKAVINVWIAKWPVLSKDGKRREKYHGNQSDKMNWLIQKWNRDDNEN